MGSFPHPFNSANPSHQLVFEGSSSLGFTWDHHFFRRISVEPLVRFHAQSAEEELGNQPMANRPYFGAQGT